MRIMEAPVFRFGDDVDTDVIIPGRYLKLSYDEAIPYVMAGIRPGFAQELQPQGGIVVAGKNFGCGSSREAAPATLKKAGIQAIVAPFFARIFYRNAINVGLPVVECPAFVESSTQEGEVITIDLGLGTITRAGLDAQWTFAALPPHLQAILEAGGLVPYLKRSRRSLKGE